MKDLKNTFETTLSCNVGEVHKTILLINTVYLGPIQGLRGSCERLLTSQRPPLHKDKHFCFTELDLNQFEANVNLKENGDSDWFLYDGNIST